MKTPETSGWREFRIGRSVRIDARSKRESDERRQR